MKFRELSDARVTTRNSETVGALRSTGDGFRDIGWTDRNRSRSRQYFGLGVSIAIASSVLVISSPSVPAAMRTACTPDAGYAHCVRYVQNLDSEAAFFVPDDVSSIHVRAWGGGGSPVGAVQGGGGGYVRANLTVTPGATVRVVVGAAGPGGFSGIFTGARNVLVLD